MKQDGGLRRFRSNACATATLVNQVGETEQAEEEQQNAANEKEEASELSASDIGRASGKLPLLVDFNRRGRWNRWFVRCAMLGRSDCGCFGYLGCRRGSAW